MYIIDLIYLLLLYIFGTRAEQAEKFYRMMISIIEQRTEKGAAGRRLVARAECGLWTEHSQGGQRSVPLSLGTFSATTALAPALPLTPLLAALLPSLAALLHDLATIYQAPLGPPSSHAAEAPTQNSRLSSPHLPPPSRGALRW